MCFHSFLTQFHHNVITFNELGQFIVWNNLDLSYLSFGPINFIILVLRKLLFQLFVLLGELLDLIIFVLGKLLVLLILISKPIDITKSMHVGFW